MTVLAALQERLFSGRRKTKKWSKGMLGFDLYYQLSYMSTIAAAGVPRDQVFERAARLQCSAAEYFKKVELARQRLKYDYARACRAVGEPQKDEEIKGLLLRMSSSLISGEPEASFLSREAKTKAQEYENEYGRSLEALKLWTDAYVSLILAAVLVVVIGVVSTMIWKIQTGLIIGMTVLAVMVTAVGAWLIWVMAPKEPKVLSWPGSKEQKIASKYFVPLLATAVVCGAALMLTGRNLGMALLVASALLFPIGFIMSRDDRKVTKRDGELGTFLHSLGGVCAALGTTVNAALGRIDLNAINILRQPVKNLYTRLNAGIRPKVSWQKFVEETGSELANRAIGMFYDAIEVGGSAAEAGEHASAFADRVALLRARRQTVCGPFKWLCITMHTAVVVILIFITEVIVAFGNMLGKAQSTMPKVNDAALSSPFSSFNLSGLEMMHNLVLPLVLIFTVADALAPYFAEGGSKYKILNNLGITGTISGVALLVLPTLAHALFTSVSRI